MNVKLRIIIAGLATILGVGFLVLVQRSIDSELPRKKLEPQLAASDPQTLSKTTTAISGITPAAIDPKAKAAHEDLLALFHKNEFDAAIALANRQLTQADLVESYKIWLREQLPILLNSAGWLRIQKGQYEEAADLLQQSLSYRVTSEAHKGLALCFYKMKQMFDADSQWRSFAKLTPADGTMLLLHTDILESIGEYEEAAALLEGLSLSKETLPLKPIEIVKKQAAMQAKAREAGHQNTMSSEHFSLTYRVQDHDKLAPLTLDLLEAAYENLRSEFGLNGLNANLEVFLYPEERFQTLVANSPTWAGGIFDGRLRLPISQKMLLSADPAPLLRKVVRHELAHAMLADQIDKRRLPPWFSEGFAQYVECSRGCGFQNFPVMRGLFLKADSFLEDFISLDRTAAERSYKQSLYLVLVLQRGQLFEDSSDPLRQVVEQLSRTSQLDSESILKPLNLNFSELVKRAAQAWDRQERFSGEEAGD